MKNYRSQKFHPFTPFSSSNVILTVSVLILLVFQLSNNLMQHFSNFFEVGTTYLSQNSSADHLTPVPFESKFIIFIAYQIMPGMRCHAIQRNKHFVVYSVYNYLLKCYDTIFCCFSILRKNEHFFGISYSRTCKHIIVHMQIVDFQDLVDTLEAINLVLC